MVTDLKRDLENFRYKELEGKNQNTKEDKRYYVVKERANEGKAASLGRIRVRYFPLKNWPFAITDGKVFINVTTYSHQYSLRTDDATLTPISSCDPEFKSPSQKNEMIFRKESKNIRTNIIICYFCIDFTFRGHKELSNLSE